MNPSLTDSPALRFLLTAAAFVVVVAGIRAAGALIVPFLLAVFLAIICAQPLLWLTERKVPMPLALIFVVAMISLILLMVGVVVGASINEFTQDLPIYQERLKAQTAGITDWLQSLGVDVSQEITKDYFNPGAALTAIAGALAGLGGVLTNTFLIILTVIFILLEAADFPEKIQAAFGRRAESYGYFRTFTGSVRHYMALKTIISLATGALIAAWLAILGVDYPLLWGLVAFLFNYVPNIGSIIAAIPAVLLAFIQLGVGSAGLAALGYLVVNSVIGNMIEPRVMGRGLGLSTLVVFISLVFWGWALGPVGMFLSVPLTMTLKIALENADETRPIAILLGPAPEPPETAEPLAR